MHRRMAPGDSLAWKYRALGCLTNCRRCWVAVADRLVSYVPPGCILSGGIDSGLLVAMAREVAGGKISQN